MFLKNSNQCLPTNFSACRITYFASTTHTWSCQFADSSYQFTDWTRPREVSHTPSHTGHIHSLALGLMAWHLWFRCIQFCRKRKRPKFTTEKRFQNGKLMYISLKIPHVASKNFRKRLKILKWQKSIPWWKKTCRNISGPKTHRISLLKVDLLLVLTPCVT